MDEEGNRIMHQIREKSILHHTITCILLAAALIISGIGAPVKAAVISNRLDWK
jgi:hypothetical protein